MPKPFKATNFGRYLLTDRLAVGGMAEIFNAKVFGAMGFEKRVVIKRILPQLAGDAEFLRMFVTEAKLVCHLDHPNIVQVSELGEIGSQYYIAMEHINGIDGRQLWRTLAKRKQRLPGVLALFVVAEVLKGLDYAHRAVGPDNQVLGVVHRDVSPSNILISQRGDVKISDFGIALVHQESKTKAGVLKGKYGYMSPEQVAGLPVDHRSDIFAAGIVLAEFLLGRRLFLGRSDFETLDRVLNVRLHVLRRHEKSLPEEVTRIVHRALQREPDKRYQSARDFKEDIMDFLFSRSERVTAEALAGFIAHHVLPHVKPSRGADKGDTSNTPADKATTRRLQSPMLPGDLVPASLRAATSDAAHHDDDDDDDIPEPQQLTREVAVAGLTFGTNAGDTQGTWGPTTSETEQRAIAQTTPTDTMTMEAEQPGPLASNMVTAQLPAASDDHADRPDYTGELGSTSAARALFRFSIVKETGLLTLTGPDAKSHTDTYVDHLKWVHKCTGVPLEDYDQAQLTCEIHMDHGRPDLASADRNEHALVAHLLEAEVFSRPDVKLALKEHPDAGLVPALLATGRLTPLQIPRHITSFVLDRVFDTFAWETGRFAFFRNRRASHETFPTGLGPIELLKKSIYRLSENSLDRYFQRLPAGKTNAQSHTTCQYRRLQAR